MERRYEEGVRRGLGINLHVFCYLNARPLCYIWLPEDETDAEYRMLTGLKLSAPSEPGRQTVVGIRWKLRWVWLRWMERRISKHRWADDIPKQ
ncbi:MAG: hypothetical protein HOL01_12705 [Planctomycetaceae bacterium]|nr:hypothetical protein [Planctomycetaceae bacterium]